MMRVSICRHRHSFIFDIQRRTTSLSHLTRWEKNKKKILYSNGKYYSCASLACISSSSSLDKSRCWKRWRDASHLPQTISWKMINDFVCMTSIPRLKCFLFCFSSFFFFFRFFFYFSDMGFCGFGLPTEDMAHIRGGPATRAPLCTFMKSSYVTCVFPTASNDLLSTLN
jgi:hypothetical protein